jgi:hypothetical protein
MTENDIIKALECCTNPKVGEICPRANFADVCTDGCIQILMVQALDLINRQKSEIEKKDIEIDILIRKKEALKDEVSELRAENERLKVDKILCLQIGPSKRLFWKITEDIKNLVKEMVGDDNA